MKYNGVYEVDPAFIENGAIKWVWTGNGEYIIATSGGIRYFVKRNAHARYPTKGTPKPVYAKYKAEADALTKKQERLRTLMSGLSLSDDHIVAEEQNFWDSEKMFTTVTVCVPDALPEKYDYTALTSVEFIKLSALTADALVKLHAHGVIHGDLKGKNILVTKKDGAYIPYLIDFDSSYPADAIPAWENIGGSEGYQSPEVMLYGSDEGAADKTTITPATDIFSFAVVMHKWWTGAFPGVDMEHGSVGAAVYLEKAVTIDKKFDVRIGDNCGATLASLINWMIARSPADRPTAQQVADVLNDRLEVPERFHKGSDEKPFDCELWDAHKLVAELLPVSVLKRLGIKSIKRIYEGGGSMSLKYRIVGKDGTEKRLTVSELCESGYAKLKSADVDAPWDEHMIEFEPADVIARKGYAKIKRVVQSFRKRYLITTASGREIDKSYEWLVTEGLAHLKLNEIAADTPWPEHGKAYDTEAMARMGVKSISRVEIGGEHRYKLVYHEIVDGGNKINDRVPVKHLLIWGFIK